MSESPRHEAAAEARVWLTARSRWGLAEIAFWAAAAASWFLFPARHSILAEIAILALFALSLDLILGYVGIVSLGHAAFLGLGAYSAGLIAKHVGGEPLLGLFVAVAVAGVAGFASSFLVLRGSDLTRLMVTLGVALLLGEVANQWVSLTGGADGLQGMSVAPLLGLFEFDLFGRTAHAYALVVLFLCFLIARRVVRSPYGLSLRAIRDNPLRAAALGVAVDNRIVGIYTLAAAFAGAAGALLAHTTAFVSLDVFDFTRSADVMLVLVIGGAGYLYGGLIGAIFFKIAADVLSAQTPQYWHFWIGLMLVVLVLVGRERIHRRVVSLWPGRRSGA